MKKNNKKKLNKAGYTLVELIIVVTIIAVFTSMSAVALAVIKNRNISKYSKMVNEVISDFYKNATTKDGEWKMLITFDGDQTYTFAQYKDGDKYYTESIDGTKVYSVRQIDIDDCNCTFYKDGNKVAEVSETEPVELYVSRERAVFDKDLSDVDRIVFSNSTTSSQVNIVLGTPNNYVGQPA